MLRCILDAMKDFDLSSEFGRWLLPNGMFLDIEERDHRVVGNYCDNDWLDFLLAGAVSINLSSSGDLSLRIYERLTNDQKEPIRNLIVHDAVSLYVDFYNSEKHIEETLSWDMNDLHDGLLYITDPIAYAVEMSYREDEYV